MRKPVRRDDPKWDWLVRSYDGDVFMLETVHRL